MVLINELSNPSKRTSILMRYFAKYLIEIRGLKQSSVNHYFDALKHISKRLREKGIVKEDIYEITELSDLLSVKEILYKDKDFVELNERGNHMYSSGLDNYIRFAKGDDFSNVGNKINYFDIPFKKPEQEENSSSSWKRSTILRSQVINMSNYKCEINPNHISFIAQATKMPYMEGHHVIPMRLQKQFENSLDVYANIVCLCPLCHRKIHYGLNEERIIMVQNIYAKRADRLVHSGIKLSKDEFTNIVINQ